MIEIPRKQSSIIEAFYKDSQDTLVWSYFDDMFGKAWADSIDNPTCVKILSCGFLFFAGDANSNGAKELVSHVPEDTDFIIAVCPDEAWTTLFEEVWHNKYDVWNRFTIKKEGDVFNREKLKGYINALDPKYTIHRIDSELYKKCYDDELFIDFVYNFEGEEDFLNRGIGFVVMLEDKIVGGCSSYSAYSKGIEIEVDTAEEYRNQGIAAASAATLILYCLEHDLYPAWDAANMTSVRLAERLGYHFGHEYTVYAVDLEKVGK